MKLIYSKINNIKFARRCLSRSKNMNGFTLLYSVLVLSVVLTTGLVVANIVLREIKLSGIIRDSQKAFFAADTGVECALYWDIKHEGEDGSAFGRFVSPTTLNNGLRGYWRLDENGGTVALDSSESSNNGVLENSPTWTTPGRIGVSALEFDGSSDRRVNIPHNASLFSSNQVTIAAWVWRDTTGSTHTVFSDFLASESPDVTYGVEFPANATQLRLFSNGLVSGSTNENELALGTIGAYPVGTDWFHIAVTWDGFDASFYLDGVLKDTVSFEHTPTFNGASSYSIGRRAGGAGDYDGMIDEVRFYNRPLNSGEIQALALTSPFGQQASQGSGLECNSEDITDPSSGWDSGNWETTSNSSGGTVIFDMMSLDSDNRWCSTITVTKSSGQTTVDSLGYNTCDEGDPRRVERGFRAIY